MTEQNILLSQQQQSSNLNGNDTNITVEVTISNTTREEVAEEFESLRKNSDVFATTTSVISTAAKERTEQLEIPLALISKQVPRIIVVHVDSVSLIPYTDAEVIRQPIPASEYETSKPVVSAAAFASNVIPERIRRRRGSILPEDINEPIILPPQEATSPDSAYHSGDSIEENESNSELEMDNTMARRRCLTCGDVSLIVAIIACFAIVVYVGCISQKF